MSSNNSYSFVPIDQFAPNSGGWNEVGQISSYSQNGAAIQLESAGGPAPILYFYSPTLFRVRFNAAADYSTDNSYAVVGRDMNFNPDDLKINDTANAIEIDTGAIQVVINKDPYGISVYKGSQLIHADTANYNLVFNKANGWVANFKVYPSNALYFGFGEKGGSTLAKNQCTMTFFNFDNFTYASGPLPSNPQYNATGGPLDPNESLYNSTPFLLEVNPDPTGEYQGPPYSYGIFLDNPSQTYVNIGVNSALNMYGQYYFGALYGDLDYYLILGSNAPDVINQFSQLVGRAQMPPKYVFGYHQGCYGYFDRYKLEEAANAYRAASIPCDGLHIDVDFQNNYRTFTSSDMKFPNVKELFDDLHEIGFKCSTNVTSLISANPYDEQGNQDQVGQPGQDSYPARLSGLEQDAFIYDTVADGGENPNQFIGNENYGTDFGTNPYPYPPLTPNSQGQTALGSYGYYPDFGNPAVQQWWGQQYEYLLSIGIDMIWQDMTCPALSESVDNPATYKTFPLNLMMSSFGSYQPNGAIHNAYGLLLCEATSNGLNTLRPGQRNFIICRGGYAGMQRYAALWTGDSASSWEFLQINVPEVLNIGISGQPISGCDIGGFAVGSGSEGNFYVQDGQAYGNITNYELYTRWMTLGAFLPWYRNHYDGYVKQFQEPYLYAEPVPTNCRTYIELRYQLIQVFYDAMYEATQTGMPIARALFLNDPDDPEVYNNLNDQFFLGGDILIAPIVTAHETANPPTDPVRSIYLPAGSEWYAFQNNQAPLQPPVEGGTTISYNAPLVQPGGIANIYIVPVYIRAGAIIPMRQIEQYVGQLAQNPLTINIYPNGNSTYTLYLDDGLTTNAQEKGEYRLTEISHTESDNSVVVQVQRTTDNYTPPEPFYYVSLLGHASPPSQVSAGGATLSNLTEGTDQEGADALASSTVNAYYHNFSINTTFIKIFDSSANITIEATF